MSATFPQNMRYAALETLPDILAISDIAVLLNYCTTAALEALPNIPVVFARSGYRHTASQASSLDGDMVLQADSVVELTGHIERLLSDDEFRRSRLKRQQVFLRLVLASDESKHPAANIADVLETRISERGCSRSATESTGESSAILALVWQDGPAVAGRWGRHLSSLDGTDRSVFLLATALVLAATAKTPADLRSALAAFKAEIGGAAAGDEKERFLLGTSLSAMNGAFNRQHWLEVIALAREALQAAPVKAARSRQFWRVAGRALTNYGFTDASSVLKILSAMRRQVGSR